MSLERGHRRGDEVPGATRAETSEESSLELLQRTRAGDESALNRLCLRYRPALRRWARGRLPAAARGMIDTDDLVQDTLVKALGRILVFEPRHDGALAAYLRQALHNRLRDEIRRAHRRPVPDTLDSGAADDARSPLEELVSREASERYEAALQRLKPEDQEAIVLRIELGSGYEEIAMALGKSSCNAARMAVVRAVTRLAREMDRGS